MSKDKKCFKNGNLIEKNFNKKTSKQKDFS